MPQNPLKSAQNCPLWQSLVWKRYQESLGRRTRLYVQNGPSGAPLASALVVIDRTAFGLSTWNIPRGPVWDDESSAHQLVQKIIEDAKQDRCMSLYFSPSHNFQFSIFNSQFSNRHEQPEATLVIDLTKSDEEILAQMKPKGRYNIGIAQKRGVVIEESKDLDAFYALLTQTGQRDTFGIKPKHHYKQFLQNLEGSFLLLAFLPNLPNLTNLNNLTSLPNLQHPPIAGLLGVVHDQTGIYYYGASDYAHRASMAPYLLQWETMRYCKRQGALRYDLLGIAPEESHISTHCHRCCRGKACLAPTIVTLNGSKDHPWAGVTRFKKQFGGTLITYPQEQEIVFKPVTKTILSWKRRLLP